MKLKYFKYRMYDTKNKVYLSEDEIKNVILSNTQTDDYEVELVSNLKTSDDKELYENDIVEVVLQDNTRLYARIEYNDEREFYMSFYTTENTISIPLETFNIGLKFSKTYANSKIFLYGNYRDENEDNLKELVKTDFKKDK